MLTQPVSRAAHPTVAFGVPLLIALTFACGSEPEPRAPPPAPPVTAPPVQSQAPAPTGIAPAQPTTTPTLSQPSSFFPCQTEAQCLAHRCNFDVGRCVWPCQTDVDCQPGFQCLAPNCLPKMGP